MLWFFRKLLHSNIYLVKSYIFAQLSHFPRRAVAYKLVQKAKSTSKQLYGFSSDRGTSLGFCLRNKTKRKQRKNKKRKETSMRRDLLFVQKHSNDVEAVLEKPTPQTCSTFKENSRGFIYANTTMRINHMFVSLRIAMCQTFNWRKNNYRVKLE